jgi:hypothetical protein
MLYIELTDNQANGVYINMELVVAVGHTVRPDKHYCKSYLVTSGGESLFVRETPKRVMEILEGVQADKGLS